MGKKWLLFCIGMATQLLLKCMSVSQNIHLLQRLEINIYERDKLHIECQILVQNGTSTWAFHLLQGAVDAAADAQENSL